MDEVIKIPGFCQEQTGRYKARCSLTEKQIIKAAKALIRRGFARGEPFSSPEAAKNYLITQYYHYEHEVFVCMFLDNKNKLIKLEELFRGTVDGASVYPREVVKKALQLNAAAVIFCHNHPSGNPDPSLADKRITDTLINALNLIDIRVLDHFIIGGSEAYSFSENGLI
jgi:DNA repair protein RadC